jgi:hypothetical protein
MTTNVHSFLNQIFYKNKKFDDEASIQYLEPWMLLTSNMIEFPSSDGIKTEYIEKAPRLEVQKPVFVESIVVNNTKSEPKTFRPKKEDTLFWCAYAAHHGEAGYWVIGNKYRNIEIEEKQKMIDSIRKDSSLFKQCNIKVSKVKIQEIMSELMLNKKTSWITFLAMCVYYKFNAIVLYENTYMEFSSSSGETFLFHRSKDGHISVDLSEPFTKESISDIKDKNLCIDSIEKPLKAASHYKITDLETMAQMVGINKDPELKWKKNDWYEALLKKCTW